MRALLLVAALHSALAVFHNPMVDQANRGHFGKEREALRQIEQVLNTYEAVTRPAPRIKSARRARVQLPSARAKDPPKAHDHTRRLRAAKTPKKAGNLRGSARKTKKKAPGFFKKPKKGNTNGHGFTSFTPI